MLTSSTNEHTSRSCRRKPRSTNKMTGNRSTDMESGSVQSDTAQTQNQSDDSAHPDRKITLFALRLAILEKSASGLGTLAFVWATVVLLGGFAITLQRPDFWCVTLILLIQGARIFTRSHELEWQHETTLSAGAASSTGAAGFPRRMLSILMCSNRTENDADTPPSPHGHVLKRTWSASKVRVMPSCMGWLSVAKNVSRLLFWVQVVSAAICVCVSLYRLCLQDYGPVTSNDRKNRGPALNIFYGLSLAEALLFLAEKGYWQWKIVAGHLLSEVSNDLGLERATGVHTVQRFFYDAYSCCVNGSVFDGLKMDVVSFSFDLLMQPSLSHQLSAISVLSAFTATPRFADETLRKIGARTEVIERLLDMLTWDCPHQLTVRRGAAEIVSRLVRNNHSRSIRVGGLPGSLESVSSLLGHDASALTVLGLRILKGLARDHRNCAKMGASRNILPKLVALLSNDHGHFKALKLALQVLRLICDTPGVSGKRLRAEILNIIYSIEHLRDVISRTGGKEEELRAKLLAIETIITLALDADGRDRIGATGGLLAELLGPFLQESDASYSISKALCCRSGEAVAVLTVQNPENCTRLLCLLRRDGRLEHLISLLNHPAKAVYSARILGNLCKCVGGELSELKKVANEVFRGSVELSDVLQEAMMGLAARILLIMDSDEVESALAASGYGREEFVDEVVKVLAAHQRPSKTVPCLRRFCVEVLMGLVSMGGGIAWERRVAARRALNGMLMSTAELERYVTFCGSVGVTLHTVSIHELVVSAIEVLDCHPASHSSDDVSSS